MPYLQPGIAIDSSATQRAIQVNPTAVPVFIGFTATGEVGVLHRLTRIDDFDDACGIPGHDSTSVLYPAVRHFFDNYGTLCYVLSVASMADLDTLLEQGSTALAACLASQATLGAIAGEPQITLICMPDSVLLDGADIEGWHTLWRAMLAARGGRYDLFCLMDTPASLAHTLACRAFSEADACHGAAYWPHLVTDYATADGTSLVLPPSAAVAAACSVTDSGRGIWKAPANVALAHVIKPEHAHVQAGALFSDAGVAVNLIRSFYGRGVRIWGARTMQASGEIQWRYVQLRRLAGYIETQLSEVARFAVFEPNNELTWARVRGLLMIWLRKLWQSGGLRGQQEDEAFSVQVGLGQSMTDEDVLAGRLVADIRMRFALPAELVYLQLQFETMQNDPVRMRAGANRSLPA